MHSSSSSRFGENVAFRRLVIAVALLSILIMADRPIVGPDAGRRLRSANLFLPVPG
jgi:hypothetical protein